MVENPRLPEFDESSPLRPSRFSHIVLRTRRFEEMARWYKTVLHAEALFEIPNGAFLTYDDEHHRMALVKTPVDAELPPGAPGLDHVAYTLPTLGDLLATHSLIFFVND